MKRLFRTFALFIALLPFACACSAIKPHTSEPATATIQTDAGPMVCEYVKLTAKNQEAVVGVCAPDESDLSTAVEILKATYPFATEILKK